MLCCVGEGRRVRGAPARRCGAQPADLCGCERKGRALDRGRCGQPRWRGWRGAGRRQHDDCKSPCRFVRAAGRRTGPKNPVPAAGRAATKLQERREGACPWGPPAIGGSLAACRASWCLGEAVSRHKRAAGRGCRPGSSAPWLADPSPTSLLLFWLPGWVPLPEKARSIEEVALNQRTRRSEVRPQGYYPW